MASLLDQWQLLGRVLGDKRLSKGDAAVAKVLLDFATDDQGAWPSIETLAERAGVHRASAIRSAARLVELGYFRRQQGGGRRNTTAYWPLYQTVASARPFEGENSSAGATVSASETVAPTRPFEPETVASVHKNRRIPVQKQSHRCDPNLPMNLPMNLPRDISMAPGFEVWWAAYPKKASKGRAERAYLKAIKTTTPETLLAAAKRYAIQRAGQDPKFTSHPATWLNDKCWLDEPTQASAQARQQGRRGGSLADAVALHASLIPDEEYHDG